jgi:hypothetical protein
LREFDEKIADVRKQKEDAIEGQDFEKAASLRDEEKTFSVSDFSWRSSGEAARPAEREPSTRALLLRSSLLQPVSLCSSSLRKKPLA